VIHNYYNNISLKILKLNMLSTSIKSVVKSGAFARQFSTIQSIRAREILDSRGNPTVEADVITSDG
jgi:hypothetical protein